MKDFPELAIRPGEYSCEWSLSDRVLPGEINVEAARPPELRLYGDMEEVADPAVRAFPERHQIGRLLGRLRSNHDVLVRDASVLTWFVEQNLGHGRYAIVGVGIADVPEDRYARIRLQVTGADRLFGVAPIEGVSWPATLQSAEPFSARFNPASRKVWRDDDEGVSVDCGYELRMAPHPYRFEVASAPTVDFEVDVALTLDEWLTDWVQPLIEVASLATRNRERLAWLTVHHDPMVTGVVFGSGIDQAPFQATFEEEWQEADQRPLFTLNNLPTEFPRLLREWRVLSAGDNPFVELSRLALSGDMPGRARFLYLVQALEALHSYENQDADTTAQERFEEHRGEVLAELESTAFNPRQLRFLRQGWSVRRPDSLERRLSPLLKSLPTSVRADLERPEMAGLANELRDDENATNLQAQIRVLRNRLSHGTRNYSEAELRPWVRALEIVSRANLLRLIGFDEPAIEKALAPPP